MAMARIPVIFIFVSHLLQVFVQGQILCSCSSGGPRTRLSNIIASDPRIGELITKAKSQKLLASQDCSCGNKEITFDIQSNKPQQNGIGIQEYFELKQQQQQALNFPLNSQPLSVNVCPPLGNQYIKQPESFNHQQYLGLQQAANGNLQETLNANSQSINWQPVNQQFFHFQPTTESLSPALNLQQLSFQQQCSNSIPIDNLQFFGQQASVLPEIHLATLPAINGQTQGLPSQITQGVLSSNSGLSTSFPSIASNPCSTPVTNQVPLNIPQNNAASFCNSPTWDGSQNANVLSESPTQISSDCTTNNVPQSNSVFVPFNSQTLTENKQGVFLEIDRNPNHYLQNSNQFMQVQQPIQTPQPVQSQQPTPKQQHNQEPIQKQSIEIQQPYQIQQPIQTQQSIQTQQQTKTQESTQMQRPIQLQQPVQPQYVQSQSAQLTNFPCEQIEVQLVPQTTTATASSALPQSTPDQPVIMQPSVPASSAQTACFPDQSQIQPQSMNSMLLSQLQTSGSSLQYPSNPSIYSTKHGSKSTMKALLPLLFNLLKEKNCGCGCPPNCKCGYINNCGHMQDAQRKNLYNNYNNNNFNNNMRLNPAIETDQEEEDEEEEEEEDDDSAVNVSNNNLPQVSDSYANQIKYGLAKEKEVSQNCIESAEIVTSKSKVAPKKVQEMKKYATKDYQYQNHKKMKNNSIEDDDDDYESYENED